LPRPCTCRTAAGSTENFTFNNKVVLHSVCILILLYGGRYTTEKNVNFYRNWCNELRLTQAV